MTYNTSYDTLGNYQEPTDLTRLATSPAETPETPRKQRKKSTLTDKIIIWTSIGLIGFSLAAPLYLMYVATKLEEVGQAYGQLISGPVKIIDDSAKKISDDFKK